MTWLVWLPLNFLASSMLFRRQQIVLMVLFAFAFFVVDTPTFCMHRGIRAWARGISQGERLFCYSNEIKICDQRLQHCRSGGEQTR